MSYVSAMKPEYIFTISAAIFGVLVTQLFWHQVIGEWVNSFFAVPYNIAIYIAPISFGLFAYVFSRRWYKKHKDKKRIFSASLAITIPSFLMYGLVHSVIASLSGAQDMFSLLFVYVLLGGMLFLPFGIIVGAFAAYLVTMCTNKASRSTAKNESA